MLLAFFLILACGPAGLAEPANEASASERTYDYQPSFGVAASLEPILRHVSPGNDAFPEEREARELAGRLRELGGLLRQQPFRAGDAVDRLLAPDFTGGRLTPVDEVPVGSPSLGVFRARTLPAGLVRDRRSFGDELTALVADLREVQVAEFLITAIEVKPGPDGLVRTNVRFDIAGAAAGAWRAERLGRWEMQWRRGDDGAWRVVQWTCAEYLRSRASAPVFTEVTEAALGRNAAFHRQLGPGNDAWLATLDSALLPDTMALHGMAVGDADGDGLDDLYLSQPSGLPNRLFRNRGDGTFEDVTENAGLGVLDGTSQSLFADVDNDGDQDLILVTRTGLLLFVNDGKGHFSRVPDAFRFNEPLRGSPTSIAVADYDRDGFLDVYLCTYSYFIGASEDKAGPATPYHDARNGPPNVLFRNDGRGRFVDVTKAVGLDENNDRFSLAAAWGDYDGDGWPDLLVANDFGRKNLYHNLGTSSGPVRFEDVAPKAGVEDPGAGMSATWLDYDNDGLLDVYTGNMWTAAGQRVTGEPGFMPEAPAEIREQYRRHARGNALFRNRGDGTFADVTLETRTEMGRWAWSSDAFDFDLDGREDLYVVNGMFTRDGDGRDHDAPDLDSFFWRQVVARSPSTWRPGTSFDDGWRAINRLLLSGGSEAPHERNVVLRNDGKGRFDDVSGSVGLDLDQDGRSFAAFDYDGDGDPDMVVFAPRASPQLRIFRNDFPERNAALALRLVGAPSNRDAVGARVTVETEDLRRTQIVMAGSGFLSQRSRDLLFGLGKNRRIAKVTIRWPSGLVQTLSDLPVDHRVWIEEGSEKVRPEPMRRNPPPAGAAAVQTAGPEAERPPAETWLYEPFPAPDFRLRDLEGQEHSLAGLRGGPAVLLFWATWAPPSRAALEGLVKERPALAAGGVKVLAVSVDPARDEPEVRAAARGLGLSVVVATDEMAGAYAILNRYLFARKDRLRLPTALLLSGDGNVVKVYRSPITSTQVLADVAKIDAPAAERLARAAPFGGTYYTAPEGRNYFQYALELGEQGFEAASLTAFQRVAEKDPSAITFYNLGTLYMKGGHPAESKKAFERALHLKADYAEASNSLGALLAQSGDVSGAIARFRAALATRPDYPDALNNLGYALFQTGQDQEAYDLYQRALELQPDFPEALNNLGIFFGQHDELARAESHFKKAVEKRPGYGEAANNLALVLAARDDSADAITVLQRLLEANPGFEMAYVTLVRIYLATGRQREGVQVLELLLQRNPTHPLGLQMLRQIRGGR